jgi:(2Fe-2S) ferredoxin
MSYYRHHIFFCLNARDNGQAACAQQDAQAAFDHCKQAVKAAGLNGPVAVVYPEAVWYTYVDQSDIAEIVDSHLVKGQPVERLRLPPDVGR